MNNEEYVFDYMAAAEDTGRQLAALIKAVPGEVRTTHAAEYRQSPWLKTLPPAADRMIAAAERAESASVLLTRKAKIAGLFACLATVILPFSTWAIAYWQTADVRRSRDVLQSEVTSLTTASASLKRESGGGARLVENGDGQWLFILPYGKEFDNAVRLEDGRTAYVYSWP